MNSIGRPGPPITVVGGARTACDARRHVLPQASTGAPVIHSAAMPSLGSPCLCNRMAARRCTRASCTSMITQYFGQVWRGPASRRTPGWPVWVHQVLSARMQRLHGGPVVARPARSRGSGLLAYVHPRQHIRSASYGPRTRRRDGATAPVCGRPSTCGVTRKGRSIWADPTEPKGQSLPHACDRRITVTLKLPGLVLQARDRGHTSLLRLARQPHVALSSPRCMVHSDTRPKEPVRNMGPDENFEEGGRPSSTGTAKRRTSRLPPPGTEASDPVIPDNAPTELWPLLRGSFVRRHHWRPLSLPLRLGLDSWLHLAQN